MIKAAVVPGTTVKITIERKGSRYVIKRFGDIDLINNKMDSVNDLTVARVIANGFWADTVARRGSR